MLLMMKAAILLVCLVFRLCAKADNTSAKYEHVNVDALLSNNRTLKHYMNCVLEKGPCSPEGQDLKENIPRALKNACSGCNNSQKYFVRKMALYVMKNRPSEWLEVARKYNPTGEHQEVFHRFLAEGR